GGGGKEERKRFFFVKKKQKTFICGGTGVETGTDPDQQSFFASFCSQKEVLPLPYLSSELNFPGHADDKVPAR
ncbi:MAG: hypothetical protein PHI71_17645, partial [Acidiphilium sp.]|nr:hypothetical protein [Acidiphilium sp.]